MRELGFLVIEPWGQKGGYHKNRRNWNGEPKSLGSLSNPPTHGKGKIIAALLANSPSFFKEVAKNKPIFFPNSLSTPGTTGDIVQTGKWEKTGKIGRNSAIGAKRVIDGRERIDRI